MSRVISCAAAIVVLCACVVFQSAVSAAPITWIGGNADWADGIANNPNWNPNDEPDTDDQAIFNTPNTVNLATANDIAALTMSGGIDLNLNGQDLNVTGLVQLSTADTTLFIGGSGSLLSADDITIGNGATMRMTGGTVTVQKTGGDGLLLVNAGGTLSGNGIINFTDAVGTNTNVMTLSGGTLNVTSTASFGDPFGSNAATLTINIADTDGRLNLDDAGAIVNIQRNDTLEVNGRAHTGEEPFSGTYNLGEGATLDISVPWQIDTGVINVNTNSILVGVPGNAATIAGGQLGMTGPAGAINLDSLDSLNISAPFLANGGAINNAGHVIFDANSTINSGADFQMTGTSARITVNAGVTVAINDANFDADGAGASTNVLAVNSGGLLDLNLGAGANEALNGTINLNGGHLEVTTASNNWSITRALNVGANTGTSQVSGEQLTVTSANITVGADSTLTINAPVVWNAGGNLIVNAGAVVRLGGATTFSNPGSFTGAGTLRTGGNTNFAGATTIDMPSGTVDLDGSDLIGNTVTLNADVTINAGTLASFGALTFGGADTLVLNDSLSDIVSLTVNLTDPNAEWTLTSNGVLDINAIPIADLGGGGIQGSDFNMAGTAEISGNSIWGARTDISGTVTIISSGSLNLRGGDLTDANVNRLEGGTITGSGFLRALVDEGMFGFGAIETDIEFLNNTELRADNGTLNLDAPIVEVGVIGTADDDGILDVGSPWNTNVAELVELKGGELRGAAITNAGAAGINGHGLVSAPVLNNTRIEAENGTLLVQTALNNNDWDGAGAGTLRATAGNLEIRDNVAFPFGGGVVISDSRELFVNGFALNFLAGSSLSMGSGTYRSTNATNFGGAIVVSAGDTALIDIGATATFQAGSTTTLNGNLNLGNSNTVISVGADFTGAGKLVNLTSGRLQLNDALVASDLAVLVENQGLVRLGAPATAAQVQATDFQQTASGNFDIEIGGTGLNDFDRLTLTGAAGLAGGLNLTLIGGFTPAVGQTFNIISAPGGVSGAFTSVDQPATMPAGLLFDVVYSAFQVQLQVVLAPIFSADFDVDGDVDGDDLDVWTASFGVNDGADADNDGDSDGGDFLAWQQQLGSVPAVPAGGAVPEPASQLLLAAALIAGFRFRRQAVSVRR
jgi:hypothetical protein